MTSRNDEISLPRLFVETPLQAGEAVPLSQDQLHYLKTVMRRPDGASLRLFNGRDGEWIGTLAYTGKKEAALTLVQQGRTQSDPALELHLMFCPIRKERMDMMIEKATELGATSLHPVLSARTTIRDINPDRMRRQITEAAEQCERMGIPQLNTLVPLEKALRAWARDIPLYAAIEREQAPRIGQIPVPSKVGLLIGPEGGFTEEERTLLKQQPFIRPVTLGEQVLRSETAAISGLSLLSGYFRP